jgi:hypothetical protein
MIVKVVLLFLVAMAVIGFVGTKFRRPPPAQAKFCAACGRPMIGVKRGSCPCGKG